MPKLRGARAASLPRSATRSPQSKADTFWIAGLFLLALTLRLIHLVLLRGSPFFSNLLLDSRMYDEWGQRIAAGEWIGGSAFFQDPLYAYFLGLFYAVFGHHHEPVVLAQSFLGSLVPPLLFLAARGSFGRPAAGIAGLAAALYLPSIYYEGLILKTALGLFLVSLLLYLLSRASITASKPVWLAAGAVLGLACLGRGNLVFFVPVLGLWILLRQAGPESERRGRLDALRRRFSARRRWIELSLCLCGTSLILAASAAHNRAAAGEWILTTSNAGQNFYLGNNPLNSTGEYERLPFVDANPKHEERDFAREAARRTGRNMAPGEVSRFWFDASLDWIRERPGDWLRLTWLKFRAFWGAYEIPDNLDYYLYREQAPLLRLPLPGFGLVAPFGLLGALLATRRGGWPLLLRLFLLVYSLSVVLFFVFSRFRMAMLPALFLLGGYGAVELKRRLSAMWRARNRPGRPLGWVALPLLLLGLLAFVNLPVRGVADGWSYRLAGAVGLPTRLETTAMAHYNLGLVYAARAKREVAAERLLAQAEAELRRAVELDGSLAGFHVELGKVLARQQRNREAIEVYRRAERIEPTDFRTPHALGLLARRVDDLDGAEQAFGRALRLAPGHAASAVELGHVLLQQGRAAEAARAFRQALRVAPRNRRAQEGLQAAERENVD